MFKENFLSTTAIFKSPMQLILTIIFYSDDIQLKN